MLSQIGCLASCDQFLHLYHLFCMQSNAIFHFYRSLHLFVSSALIVESRGVDYAGDVSPSLFININNIHIIFLPHFFIGQLCSRHVEVLMEQCI